MTLEITPALAAVARANLQRHGVDNVEVRQRRRRQRAAAEGPPST